MVGDGALDVPKARWKNCATKWLSILVLQTFGIDVYVMFAMGRRGRRPLPTDQSTLQTPIYRLTFIKKAQKL